MKTVIFILTILFASTAFGVDEYILPDAKNYVDTRHLKRAVCRVLYYDLEHTVVAGGVEAPKDVKEASIGIGTVMSIGSLSLKIMSKINDGAPGVGKYGSPGLIFMPPTMNLAGEGVVCAETDTHYYILTAGHVVNKPREYFIQFSYAGERSRLAKAIVIQKTYTNKTSHDLATIKVDKSELQGYPAPTILKMPDNDVNLEGLAVTTIRFGVITPCTITKERLLDFTVSAHIHKGNSGSPVFDKNAKHLLGLVLTTGGECISYKNIQRILREHNETFVAKPK